jgi:hypothetical protein
MAYSFDDAHAKEQRHTQYFEMLGNRAIYEVEGTSLRTPAQIPPDGSSLLYYFGTSTTTLRRPNTYRRTRVWIEQKFSQKKNPTISGGAVSVPNLAARKRCDDHSGGVTIAALYSHRKE